jgi:hypothetical protein
MPRPVVAWAADLPAQINESRTTTARIATRQLMDIDADGSLPTPRRPPPTSRPWPRCRASTTVAGWARRSRPTPHCGSPTAAAVVERELYHRYNTLDVTGDGVVDLIELGNGSHLRVHTEPVNQPLRLLRAVDSGQGAITRVDYAPSTDSVVDTSAQPLPFVRWVVRGITVEPGAGQPAIASQFAYANPMWFNTTGGAHDPRTFIGFARMTTDAATTAALAERTRTVATFTYAGGTMRPASEWVYGSTGAAFTVPLRHAQHTWTTAPLYAGGADFTYESATVEHHCGPAATEASCLADVAGTRARGSQYDAILGADGRPRGYLHARAVTAIDATRSRQESMQYRVDQSYAHYGFDLIRTQTDAGQATTTVFGTTTALTPMARTRYELDAAGHQLRTWVSTADGVELLTERTYDLAGNVKTVRKPSQATRVTTTAYIRSC